MVIAVFVFAFVGRPAWPVLIASRILLLPVIAGLAYELIRFGAPAPEQPDRPHAADARPVAAGLTTREPTLDQVEISINALRDALERRGAADPRARRRAVEVMSCDSTLAARVPLPVSFALHMDPLFEEIERSFAELDGSWATPRCWPTCRPRRVARATSSWRGSRSGPRAGAS